MNGPVSFGSWLKQRRKMLDLTQADLARRVGCATVTIQKIEADERRPSLQVAELLADCLEISAADRPIFLKIARAGLRVDRLAEVAPPPHRLASLDATAESPPYRPAPLPPLEVPTPPTPLIGRQHELAEIARLLQHPQCRLLSLIGPGGVGKTRLAIEAAARQRQTFADGIYFVPLTPVSAGELIVPTIAGAIGFNFYGSADPQVQLLNYLRQRQLLLILDNLEHLLPPPQSVPLPESGLGVISAFLQQAPAIKLLVTSRERLKMQGEWVFEIGGLSVPPGDQTAELEEYSAALLFLQSAQRAQVGFVLPVEERPAVARLCRLVEGMPLGIELAAAWVRTLSCQEIAQETERSMDFLAASTRDVPDRHRSLRAVFDHSWKLLSAEEQQVMRRLSVFRGGFRREAAEAVAEATLPLLSALVDKSLLRRMAAGRYDLHELIRQYAEAKLQEIPQELEATRDRHSTYYTDFAQQRETHLKGARQWEALADMSVEIYNIRAGWRHAIRRDLVGLSQKPLKSLWLFHEIRGGFYEAEAIFAWAVATLERAGGPDEQAGAAHVILREFIRALQGWFCLRLGQREKSRALLQHSLALLRSHGAQVELAHILYYMGVLDWLTGNFTQARALLQEKLALDTQLGDRWDMALVHATLNLVAQSLGEYREARRQMQAAIAMFRALGDQRMVAASLNFLGGVECLLGAYAEAEALLRENLALSRTLDDRWSVGLALSQLGVVAQMQGKFQEATGLFRESLAQFRELGDLWGTVRSLNFLGTATWTLGDYAEARQYFLESLATAMETQSIPDALDALVGLAGWQMKERRPEQGLELIAHVLSHPASTQAAKDRAGQLRAELETQLPARQIEAALAQAPTRRFETVVQELLDHH